MVSVSTAPRLNPIRLLYDTWDNAGNRHAAGVIVELPLSVAKELVATGKGERADPFPSEL